MEARCCVVESSPKGFNKTLAGKGGSTMRSSLLIGLVVALLAVGVAVWLLHSGLPSKSPLIPSQPAGGFLLVLEPLDSDDDNLPPVTPPDLTKVDRRVIEPAGLVNPRYCLLLFGPQAKTRVWIVEAGEMLYVDRNANGDLTEPGEAFAPTERQEFMTVGKDGKQVPYREWTYTVGDLLPADGTERHTRLELVRYQEGSGPEGHACPSWSAASLCNTQAGGRSSPKAAIQRRWFTLVVRLCRSASAVLHSTKSGTTKSCTFALVRRESEATRLPMWDARRSRVLSGQWLRLAGRWKQPYSRSVSPWLGAADIMSFTAPCGSRSKPRKAPSE